MDLPRAKEVRLLGEKICGMKYWKVSKEGGEGWLKKEVESI